MELSKMDKVFRAYEEIKLLDAEIIELDKVAMQLANDDTEVSLDFKLTTFTEKKEETSVSLESIYDSYKTSLFNGLWFQANSTTPENNKNNRVFSHSISTTNSLKILGILLSDKMEKRQKLLNKLSKFGVKI